jgi:lipoprotein-anchoring transpeptidase ErfK/SrfK
LKAKESEVLGAEEKLKAREHELFVALREIAARDVAGLQRVAETLAALDAEAALAECAARYGWVRPEVDESDQLVLADARHPVVERLLPRGEFVPNGVTLDGRERQILLMTGPNMGGKSTYLRQVALIVLMAQAGLPDAGALTRALGAAASIVRTALREDKSSIKFPVKKVAPETVGDDKTIVVSLGQEKLTLYEGKKADRTYPVATGAPGFPTPTGSFQIVEKRKNPTWVNPDPTGWGSSMPVSIPPGPGNPLGTRAMNLNAPGIRIHGTYELSSLGTAASHGCIRMAISDSEQLYDLVNVGTPVLIMK